MPMPQLGTMMPHKEREESIPSFERTRVVRADARRRQRWRAAGAAQQLVRAQGALVKVSVMSEGGSGTAVPDMSI
jgi:hypothetical protein